MSSLTWLAHSEAERKRTLDVIRLLDEPGTLDEIGIGGIRDAFAELLFPGTSTIQTRARYFLFVPWIYAGLEQRAPVADAGARARRDEVRLIDALMESEDTAGVIGKEARNRLQRLPSAIYWQGLQTWGVRRLPLSIRAYHRRLEHGTFAAASEAAEGEGRKGLSAWHADLPERPDGFPGSAGLALSPAEADFLRDMVIAHQPDTLLAVLASRSPSGAITADAPWEIDQDRLAPPPRVREQLAQARVFSELILGAQLLYNLMLAEASEREEEAEYYGTQLSIWAEEITAHRQDLDAWDEDRPRFWEIVLIGNPRTRRRAINFANRWFDLALGGDPKRLASNRQARALIVDRELVLKGRLARLANASALEAWNGASGSEPLLFRWRQARTLINDIGSAYFDGSAGGAA